MPSFDFKCNECGFMDEYCTNISVPKDMRPPEVCPKCKKGKLEKQFSAQGQSFDVIGGYDYQYGKKAMHKKSVTERAKILSDDNYSPY